MTHAMLRVFAGLGLLLAIGAPAAAKTSLKVEYGWDGYYRIGAWTPVFITAADDKGPARNVLLEIAGPHDRSFSIRIQQALTLRPDPQTFILYIPLTHNLSDTVAVLRDSNSGARLAEEDFDRGGQSYQPAFYGGEGELIVGAAGNPRSLRALEGRWQGSVPVAGQTNTFTGTALRTMVGGIEYRRLPDAAIGYEGLDLLVLGSPDLINLPAQQQEAIASWVRKGGRLLVWFGPHVVPATGEIAGLLPCAVGDAETIEMTDKESAAAGLPARAARLAGRKLEPREGSERVELLGGKGALITGRAGLGQAGVLSFDASLLTFDSSTSDADSPARKFWSPILLKLVPDLHAQSRRMDLSGNLRISAVYRVVDRLGDVPGVGTFDFSYIALVMIGMMLVVGPIDWFVLKKLGRQPWTWVTTAGWIGLVTFGALYLGHVLRSGDLHFRTLRVIDQADGQVVAVSSAAGIYSPKTQRYGLESPRDSWWKPTSIDPPYSWRPPQRTGSEITLHQDQRGTAPQEMGINIWHLRFLESQQTPDAQEKPLIAAKLRQVTKQGKKHIAGTITNLTDKPMREVYVRTRKGLAAVCLTRDEDPRSTESRPQYAESIVTPQMREQYRTAKGAFTEIAPGQTVQVDLELLPAGETLAGRGQRGYGPGQDSASAEGTLYPSQQAACELDMTRAMRIENMLQASDDLALVIAEIEPDASQVQIRPANGMKPIERHWQVVRAMVKLE